MAPHAFKHGNEIATTK